MEAHHDRVRTLCLPVQSFNERNAQFRMYHGAMSRSRRTKLSCDSILDTSGLNRILVIDANRRTAIVEPNVSMEQLVDACLDRDLFPLPCMEFPVIAVGGETAFDHD